MDIEKKFTNFKTFVKQISKNQEVIKEYENMSWFKLQAMAYVLLLPNRSKLGEIVKEMQTRLEFDDEHLSKFRRYIDLFVEYISGEPPEYITATDMTLDERMKLYEKEQNQGE
jgi:hypothetical protein